MSAITAAVVGVILNLAVWLGVHVVFAEMAEHHIAGLRLLVPDWASLNVASLLLTIGALVAMLHFKVGMVPTLAATAALGILYVYVIA